MVAELETIARTRFERHIAGLEGHHCPSWEGLSALMREHLIGLARTVPSEPRHHPPEVLDACA